MSSEIGWEELEEKVGKIEPGQILELNLLRKGLFIKQTSTDWSRHRLEFFGLGPTDLVFGP